MDGWHRNWSWYKKEAIETISSVSDMLKTRGLALNLAKTDIYDEEQGFYHFQIEANRYIDSIEKTKKTDADYKKVCSELHKRFKSILKIEEQNIGIKLLNDT